MIMSFLSPNVTHGSSNCVTKIHVVIDIFLSLSKKLLNLDLYIIRTQVNFNVSFPTNK